MLLSRVAVPRPPQENQVLPGFQGNDLAMVMTQVGPGQEWQGWRSLFRSPVPSKYAQCRAVAEPYCTRVTLARRTCAVGVCSPGKDQVGQGGKSSLEIPGFSSLALPGSQGENYGNPTRLESPSISN